MILSFSIPEMRPMIEAGIRQANGKDVTGRVKRQTIRRIRGPRSPWIHLAAEPSAYQLQLWWKQRSAKERAFLGEVSCLSAKLTQIRNDGGIINVFYGGTPLSDRGVWGLTYADGFETLDALRKFFTPKPGDVFNGVLIKW